MGSPNDAVDGTTAAGDRPLDLKKPGFFANLVNHPAGFWFIFWGEFAERCSFYGMRAILARYMAEELGLGEANAGTYVAFFVAACYFLPLLGGWLADNFFGKYNIIVAFSVPYILGHFILSIETPLFMAIALTLLAMGSGVIKPNISTLMGLTYDQKRPGQEQLRSNAFAIFYMSINIGATLSYALLPPIRTAYGYSIAFLVPAVLMIVAFVLFAAGKRFYAVETISRKHVAPEERALRMKVVWRVGGLFLLVSFFWAIFDQSTSTWVFFANTYMDLRVFGQEFDPEQFGTLNPFLIIVLVPLLTLLFTLLDAAGFRVRATDKMIVGFGLTALTMLVLGYAGLNAGPVEEKIALRQFKPADMKSIARQRELLADTIVMEVARTGDVKDRKTLEARLEELGYLDRARQAVDRWEVLPVTVTGGVGLLASPGPFAPLAAASATAPPRAIVSYVRPENKVTIWWQVLAFFLLTVAEVLISVTGLELAFVAAPATMKGFVTGLWLAAVGLGNLFFNAPVTRLYPAMQPGAYFMLLAATMLVVTGLFILIAKRFNYLAAQSAVADAGDSPPPESPPGPDEVTGIKPVRRPN